DDPNSDYNSYFYIDVDLNNEVIGEMVDSSSEVIEVIDELGNSSNNFYTVAGPSSEVIGELNSSSNSFYVDTRHSGEVIDKLVGVIFEDQ
ncbi:822_t:CDS:2, partial [Dentiscutata erythropus]